MKIGIDLGGTKTEGILIDHEGKELARNRIKTEKTYEGTISGIISIVKKFETDFGISETVGIGMPGAVSSESALVKNANSIWLNGKPFKKDLEKKIERKVNLENDANCFALSEAVDGAGKGYSSVFAVILGTGVGAGYVVDEKLIEGPNKLTGEWGQNPIPGPMDDYEKGIKRHCGRIGAIEVFISGPGLEQYYEHLKGTKISSREIISLYRENDKLASTVMDNYFERVARSFSTFINILDPEVIVCGGGMSDIPELYDEIPKRIIPYIASDFFLTPIVKAQHGNSSGVRGAAFLWD